MPQGEPRQVQVKICGVTRPQDAADAVALGAAYVGMIVHAKSKRLVTADQARAVSDAVHGLATSIGKVNVVGVFVDPSAETVRRIAREADLDFVQLHGSEAPEFVASLDAYRVVKVVRPDDVAKWLAAPPANLHALMLDTPGGGTGLANDWDAVDRALQGIEKTRPIWLAGGLNPENVAAVVRRFRPTVVDVASGTEDGTPGIKSRAKIEAFIRNARGA